MKNSFSSCSVEVRQGNIKAKFLTLSPHCSLQLQYFFYPHRESILKSLKNPSPKKACMPKITTIAIVGLGTLGSVIARQAALTGYNLKLIDFDDIEARNIPIQALYSNEDIGKSKVKIAEGKLKKVNPKISIQSFPEKLTSRNLPLLNSDLVIDCTDNQTARFLINDYCYKKIPFIHTAAFKDLATFYVAAPGAACLRCIYPQNVDLNDCRQSNIHPKTPEIIAELTITAIKNLTENQQEERLLRLNIKNNTLEKIRINRRCPRCQKSL